MRLLAKIFMPTILAAIFLSCSESKEDESRVHQADTIFERQKSLLKAYTDSFLRLPDSVPPDPLIFELEEQLYLATKDFSPYASAFLTEEQNDTLHLLTTRLIKSIRESSDRDSISGDTLKDLHR